MYFFQNNKEAYPLQFAYLGSTLVKMMTQWN